MKNQSPPRTFQLLSLRLFDTPEVGKSATYRRREAAIPSNSKRGHAPDDKQRTLIM